jgi:phosphatidylglycerol:prolipoprotein diacylglycerol transferase
MLPILLETPSFILYSYPLMFGLAWGVGYQILLAYQAELKLSTIKIYLLLLTMFTSSWVGAKLFFLYTLPVSYRNDLATESSFWMGGGLVFLGGLIFALIAFFIWKKATGFSFKYAFPMLLALVWGHAIGRLGCLLAGCCYGATTKLPWAIHLHGENRHPTQAYEIILLVFTAIVLSMDYKRFQNVTRSLLIYFSLYGLGRFIIEIFRGDEIRGQWGPFTPSQWVGLVMFVFGIIGLLWNRFKGKAPSFS